MWFDNGVVKVVDLKDTIFNDKREIFKPLEDIEYFKKFDLVLNTIGWQNGLDLAPEYLYELETNKKIESV